MQNLRSQDTKTQRIGLETLSVSGEIAAIPWLVPFLDSPDLEVRVWTGVYLSKLVANEALKRRDPDQPYYVVIKPLGPGDTDLRPLAWVCYHMLQKPDDGNTYSFAINMIGYLGLHEFEPALRAIRSRHPAVMTSVQNALEILDRSRQ